LQQRPHFATVVVVASSRDVERLCSPGALLVGAAEGRQGRDGPPANSFGGILGRHCNTNIVGRNKIHS
jgi:hypothetical protein